MCNVLAIGELYNFDSPSKIERPPKIFALVFVGWPRVYSQGSVTHKIDGIDSFIKVMKIFHHRI